MQHLREDVRDWRKAFVRISKATTEAGNNLIMDWASLKIFCLCSLYNSFSSLTCLDKEKQNLIHTINQNRLMQLLQVTFVILYFSPFCGWWSISKPEFKVSEKTTVLAKHFSLACLCYSVFLTVFVDSPLSFIIKFGYNTHCHRLKEHALEFI